MRIHARTHARTHTHTHTHIHTHTSGSHGGNGPVEGVAVVVSISGRGISELCCDCPGAGVTLPCLAAKHIPHPCHKVGAEGDQYNELEQADQDSPVRREGGRRGGEEGGRRGGGGREFREIATIQYWQLYKLHSWLQQKQGAHCLKLYIIGL